MPKPGKRWDQMSEEQREILRKHQFKKGQIANPEGINGWSKLRDRYQKQLEQKVDRLINVLIKLAEDGDVAALRMALGPIIDVRTLEVSGPDGTPIDFAGLAALANEKPAGKEDA